MWPLEVIIAMNEKAHAEAQAKKKFLEEQKGREGDVTLPMAETNMRRPLKKVATA